MTGPLRDRFGLHFRLELYPAKDLEKILKRSAKILNARITDEAAALLSSKCRGTPRIANRILRRARDVAEVRGEGLIDLDVAERTLKLLGIDSQGLDPMDRKILSTIAVNFSGGPVGLGTIGASLGEDPDTLEEVYEPFLIQQGFLSRTPRGRILTPRAYQALHLPTPQGTQGELEF